MPLSMSIHFLQTARHHLVLAVSRVSHRVLFFLSNLCGSTEVLEQIPAGQKAWQPVGEGKWMPFDGGAHNGGQWLHDPKTWSGAKEESMPSRLRGY